MSKGQAKRDELYKKLTEPFPEKAYAADISRSSKVLTSLKAHYVVERLNEAFGLGMWKLTGEWSEVEDGVLFFGDLQASYLDGENLVNISTSIVPGFAGVDHANSGDAYKSARTDCLCKAASLFGVGNEMYKGNIEPRLSEAQKQVLEDRTANEEREEPSQKEEKPAKEEKPKKRGFQKLNRKEAKSEKEEATDEKPQLRPARNFFRGSKLKPNRENEENGTNESTDNAAD